MTFIPHKSAIIRSSRKSRGRRRRKRIQISVRPTVSAITINQRCQQSLGEIIGKISTDYAKR